MNTFTQTIALHYLDPYPNSDKPVFLLHGLGADASSWQYQFEILGAAGFRPIAVDLPGFGRTPSQGEWSIDRASAQAMQIAREITLGRIDLVGISMGGVVAQGMARQFPERINKLVLVNTFACLRPRRLREWTYLLKRFIVASVRGVEFQAQLVAKRLFPEPEQEKLRNEMVRRIQEADPKVYKSAMRQLIRFDSRQWLGELKMPTLVISGELDSTVPLVNQRELVRGIQGARHVIIPGARHGVIVDQAEKFNEVLERFLLE